MQIRVIKIDEMIKTRQYKHEVINGIKMIRNKSLKCDLCLKEGYTSKEKIYLDEVNNQGFCESCYELLDK